MKIKFKYFAQFFLYIFIACLFTVSCKKEAAADSDEAGDVVASVGVTHPTINNLTEYLNLNATTVFLNKEIVRATFQGFIKKIDKNIGDDVKKGEPLFVIATREFAAGDSLNVQLGNSVFKGEITIKAQSSGIMTELDYHTGDYVSDGEQLAVISNPSSLRAILNVPYEYVGKINSSSRFEIILPGGIRHGARVANILPSIDAASQTQKILLIIDNMPNIPENLNVIARVPIRTVKNAVTVPKICVMSNETMNEFWIMKLMSDSESCRIDIVKGITGDSTVQVLSPALNTGDRVISVGAYGLPDTSKIRIKN